MRRLLLEKYSSMLSITLALILSLGVLPALAQEHEVTGVVTDSQKQELPGVSVYLRGTTIGTVTDANGKFSIHATDTSVVVFSSIGYIREETKVAGRSVINVELSEDVVGLEEIVVIGYGEQKRSNLSGAISSVDKKSLENRSQMRLDQALQGMAAGVNVTREGGAPGAKPTIHIRGVGSVNDTEPLWVVDGITMAPGNHFDLDDVESIEVLKDGAASAIYGARAAHGVILVTTKRGSGAVQVNFKSSIGKRSPVELPSLLRSEDYVRYKKESRLNAGQNPDPSWDNYEHDTDWVGAFYDGSGVIQSYDLSISKGDEKLNYFLSLGHDNEKGILIDNSYDRLSLRFNSDLKLFPWLKIGESMLLSRVKENPIGNNNENYNGAIPFRSTPIMPVYDPENQFGGWGTAPVYFQGPNPVATQYQQHDTRNYDRIDGNLYGELTPLKGLRIRGSLGYNFMSYLGERFDEAFYYGAFANPINSLVYSSSNDRTVTGNAYATYDKSVGKHNFKAMIGTEAIRTDVKHFNIARSTFPIDVAWSFNLGTGPYSTTDLFNVYNRRLLSYFGRINYNYDERYFVEANFRRDSSAPKFGPENIWGNFPSYSVAWRISKENFFQNVPVITNLKLRASVGKLGSDAIGDYLYQKTYTSQFSTYSFDANGTNKVSGFYISRFPNGDVKWEEVNMKNVAIDIGAFESKFNLTVDYYVKDTKDLLFPVPVPTSVGIATHNFDPVSPPINIGTMRNTGLDVELGYKTDIKKFVLTSSANASFVRNEVLSLYGDDAITGGNGGGQIGGMTRTQPGMPISSFYGYEVYRMFHSLSEVQAMNTYADDGYYQEAGTGAGDFMYRDISGPDGVPDGEITPEFDRTFIGNPWPKMTYALNFSAVYNQLIDFAIQFQGVQGVDVFNANKAYSRNFFGDSNTTTLIYEAWTPDRHTMNPRNIATDPNGNFGRPSTYFVEDGSYLKLRNIQVGLTLPKQTLIRYKIQRLRVYANANNVLTFSKYSGLDPEIAGSNTGRGVDYGMYPQVRTYSAGLEVQF